MKKLFTLLLAGSMLFLTSCGGGWSDQQKELIKNECITNGGYDCDCYVEKAVETFKDPKEYNDESSKVHEKFQELIEACKSKEDTTKDEEIESF